MVDERGHFLQVATRSTRKPGGLTASSRQELQEGTRNCASPSGRGLARRSGRSATPGVTLAGPVVTPHCYCALATSALAQAQNFCQRFPHGRGPAWVGFDTFFPCLTVSYC